MIDEMLKLRVERALGHAADDAVIRISAGDLRTMLREWEDAQHDVEELEAKADRVADLEEEVAELQQQVELQEEVMRDAA